MATVFVLNCGSSSIKFQLVEPDSGKVFLQGLVENIQSKRCEISWKRGDQKESKQIAGADYEKALQEVVSLLQQEKEQEKSLIAVGHRVVHGGEAFSQSVIVTDKVFQNIQDCSDLAPLHNPANALGIQIMKKIYPSLFQVAVFDTAFHQTMPEYAFLYAIDYKHYKDFHVRRYGFHGTSHLFVTKKASEIIQKPFNKANFISAHLGNGCSVCAVYQGKSVDTSMGFTPLEGLVMGERSGDIDPAVVGFLEEKLQIDAKDIIVLLNKKSGLLGVSQTSSDMRLIEEKAGKGDRQSILALEIFCYRLAKYIASYLVPVKDIDALIFTGGIGENSAFVRKRVLDWIDHLGFHLDDKKNQENGKSCSGVISQDQKKPYIIVVPTNEELVIAKDAKALVEGL